MDGMEATKLIRDLGFKKYIVAATANNINEQHRIDLIAMGFSDIAPKPFLKADAAKLLRNLGLLMDLE